MERNQVEQVRSFNRAVTLRIGVLNDSYLGRGRPLSQARLLFEIGPEGAELRTLREQLGLDSGYLSRLLNTLKAQGLVTIATEAGDRRRRRVSLTAKGRAEHAAYDALSDDLARSMLTPLDATKRERLLSAMAEVERLLTAASVSIAVEEPGGEAARYCLDSYFKELAARFESGFDPAKGNSAEDPAMTPPDGCFLVARLNGRPIGCGGLKRLDAGTGEIKRMWVAPDARGLGVAKRLLAELEAHARRYGMKRVCLDTNRVLGEAQALYRKAGYRDIERYNGNPYAHFWFGKELEDGDER